MPSDDRERSFEDALAGHLRAGAPKGSPQAECADAETLAAYHEGALAAEQVVSLKTHITGCERCQQILTTLETTDEIAVPAVNLTPQSTAAAAKSQVHVLPARKRALWQWGAPAGALAAALLVWVAVHENNSSIIPANAPGPNAKHDARQPATVSAPPSVPRTTPSPSGGTTSSNDASSDSLQSLPAAPPPARQSRSAGLARERAQAISKQKDSSSAAKKSAVAPDASQFASDSLNRDDSLDRNAVPAPSLEARNEPVQTGPDKAKMEQKAANGRRDAPSAKPPQSQSAPEVSASAVPLSSPPAPSSARAQASAESAGVSGGITQQQEAAGMSRFRQSEVRLANSLAEVTISSPDGQVSWRVGRAGIIEFSPDAGKSWTVQPSGVISDFLGGSASDDNVCWIVGRGGTVLLTTDTGAHWQKIRPPSHEDLRSVFAVDARQATVSSGNAKYQTTDGGSTWKKLPPQ